MLRVNNDLGGPPVSIWDINTNELEDIRDSTNYDHHLQLLSAIADKIKEAQLKICAEKDQMKLKTIHAMFNMNISTLMNIPVDQNSSRMERSPKRRRSHNSPTPPPSPYGSSSSSSLRSPQRRHHRSPPPRDDERYRHRSPLDRNYDRKPEKSPRKSYRR